MQHSVSMKNFQEILAEESIPRGLNTCQKCIWYLKKGDWDRAHDILQEEDSKDTSWVHGYLHKVEGDMGNAKYWFRLAGRKWREDVGLEDELEEIICELWGSSK